MNRWSILILVVVALAAAAAGYRYLAAGVPVQTARVVRGDIHQYVDERGKTRLSHTYEITMPFPGRIEAIRLREGDRVRAGDIVAQVVESDLANEVAAAQATVERIEAAIAEKNDHSVETRMRAQAVQFIQAMIHTVAAAEARKTSGAKRVEYADSFLARTRDLYRSNAKTEEDVELAELRLVESQVEYRQDDLVWKATESILAATELIPEIIDQYIAHKGLSRAVLEKQKAEAEARLRQALKRRERGTMLSPVDGVVLEKAVDDEQFVPAGAILLRIGRPADLEVEADILSQDATRIRKGAAATIYGFETGAGTDLSVPGTVDRVYPKAFTKISSLGVEQQRVKVIVRLDAKAVAELARLGVGPEYRVRVRIVTDRRTGVLLVPRSALFRSADGRWQVFATKGHRVRLRHVTVGLMNDEHVEILDGLEENDHVVVAPDNRLENGMRVNEAPLTRPGAVSALQLQQPG